MNQYDLLNRCVLAQCYLWIENHTEARDGELPDICYKIRGAGHSSLHINRFSYEESELLKEITSSEEFKHIREVDISLIVMALECMRLWIEDVPKDKRPLININDKRLLKGKNEYVMYMLRIKEKHPRLYNVQKEIIARTAANSVLWYNFMRKELLKEQ